MTATKTLNELAESWTRFMLDGLIDGSVLFVTLCLLWLLMRRRVSAQFGYCLFLLVLFRVVLPLQVTLPNWCEVLAPSHVLARLLQATETHHEPTQPAAISAEIRVDPAATGIEFGSEEAALDFQQSQVPIPSTLAVATPRLSLAAQLMLSWATIVVGLLSWTLVIQRRLRRVLHRATLTESERLPFDLDELRTRIGVRQQVSVWTSSELESPAVAGLWRPRVLLPVEFAASLSPRQLQWVIFHELAHIRRFDLWLSAFQRAVQIVHFFNPAVWLTNWMIDRQREYVCDDVALSAGDIPRRECAAAFLSILERVSQRTITAHVPLSFLRSPNPFRRRLMRILDTDRALRPRLTMGWILALTVIASFVVPQLRLEAFAQTEGPPTQKGSQSNAPAADPNAKPTGRPRLSAEAESKTDRLENRLESLESEVRQLRKVLQELAADRSALTGTQKRTEELYSTVKRMDLALVNRQGEIVVVNPIKSLSGSRLYTIITRLTPNGSQVQKGNLVVQLDSEKLREQLDSAAIHRESAKAAVLQASARYDIQLTQTETTLAEDQLQVALAKLELRTYLEGTYPLEFKKLEAKVTEAQEALAAVRQQVAKGFQPKGNVKKAAIALSIVEDDLTRLEKFERALQTTRLEGAVERAIATKKRKERDNAAKIMEARADKKAADQNLSVAEENLKAIKLQVEKCQVLAPADGIVRYSSDFIKTGALVRERQAILSIVPLTAEPISVLKDVLVVPLAAVQKRGDKTTCLVQTPNGLEQRNVRLGQSNASLVQVIDGLKQGEKVFVGRINLTAPIDRRSTRGRTPSPRR